MKHLQLAIGNWICALPGVLCGRGVQAQTNESTPGRGWFCYSSSYFSGPVKLIGLSNFGACSSTLVEAAIR